MLLPYIYAAVLQGPDIEIADAKNNQLKTASIVLLILTIGNCVVQLKFIVCKTLVALVLLRCDFCDRFVDAVRPQSQEAEMEDGSTVVGLRSRLLRTHTKQAQ